MREPLGLWACGKLSAALRVSHMPTAPTTATGSRRGYGFVGKFDMLRDRRYDVVGCTVDRECIPKSEEWGSTLFWPIRGPKNGANRRQILCYASLHFCVHQIVATVHQCVQSRIQVADRDHDSIYGNHGWFVISRVTSP